LTSHKPLFIPIILFLIFVGGCSSKKNPEAPSSSPSDQVAVTNQIQYPPEEEYNPKALDPKEIGTPMQAIKGLDQMIETYHLGKELTAEQTEHNSSLKQKIIRGTFDIKELCRLSLGKHWDAISEAQQKHFVGMMTTLLETKAIFSKEQLKGTNKYYSISYKNESFDDETKEKATVFTDMHVPKEKITLNITYKLLLTPYGWKIYDVVVDDASLLTNYKFQFNQIISTKGFDELFARMEKQLNKIKGVPPDNNQTTGGAHQK